MVSYWRVLGELKKDQKSVNQMEESKVGRWIAKTVLDTGTAGILKTLLFPLLSGTLANGK